MAWISFMGHKRCDTTADVSLDESSHLLYRQLFSEVGLFTADDLKQYRSQVEAWFTEDALHVVDNLYSLLKETPP